MSLKKGKQIRVLLKKFLVALHILVLEEVREVLFADHKLLVADPCRCSLHSRIFHQGLLIGLSGDLIGQADGLDFIHVGERDGQGQVRSPRPPRGQGVQGLPSQVNRDRSRQRDVLI